MDGRLAGALLLEERHSTMAVFRAIGQPVPEEASQSLARPDFPWNELTGRDRNYRFH